MKYKLATLLITVPLTRLNAHYLRLRTANIIIVKGNLIILKGIFSNVKARLASFFEVYRPFKGFLHGLGILLLLVLYKWSHIITLYTCVFSGNGEAICWYRLNALHTVQPMAKVLAPGRAPTTPLPHSGKCQSGSYASMKRMKTAESIRYTVPPIAYSATDKYSIGRIQSTIKMLSIVPSLFTKIKYFHFLA